MCIGFYSGGRGCAQKQPITFKLMFKSTHHTLSLNKDQQFLEDFFDILVSSSYWRHEINQCTKEHHEANQQIQHQPWHHQEQDVPPNCTKEQDQILPDAGRSTATLKRALGTRQEPIILNTRVLHMSGLKVSVAR